MVEDFLINKEKTIYEETYRRKSSEKKPPSLHVFQPFTSDTLRGPSHTQVRTPRGLPTIFLRTVLDSNPHPMRG